MMRLRPTRVFTMDIKLESSSRDEDGYEQVDFLNLDLSGGLFDSGRFSNRFLQLLAWGTSETSVKDYRRGNLTGRTGYVKGTQSRKRRAERPAAGTGRAG